MAQSNGQPISGRGVFSVRERLLVQNRGEISMTRKTMMAIAMGGLMIAGTPFAANAQSGDALAHAEQACSVNGVRAYSAAYNECVDRTALNFDRGAPDVAYDTASAMGDANRVCSSYGLDQHSLGYQGCLDSEMTRGVNIAQAIVAPDDQPHVAVSSDSYGFSYDRQGNLLDAGGYVIRPVPLRP
jgi:hypothetical protein